MHALTDEQYHLQSAHLEHAVMCCCCGAGRSDQSAETRLLIDGRRAGRCRDTIGGESNMLERQHKALQTMVHSRGWQWCAAAELLLLC